MDDKVGLAACGLRRARWRGGAACGCRKGVLPASAIAGDARRPNFLPHVQPRTAHRHGSPPSRAGLWFPPCDLSSAPALSSSSEEEDFRRREDRRRWTGRASGSGGRGLLTAREAGGGSCGGSRRRGLAMGLRGGKER